MLDAMIFAIKGEDRINSQAMFNKAFISATRLAKFMIREISKIVTVNTIIGDGYNNKAMGLTILFPVTNRIRLQNIIT